MIIDFHVHIYPDKVAAKAVEFVAQLGIQTATNGTRAGLEKSMQAAGIDIAVGMTVLNNPANSRAINQFAIDNNYGVLRMFGSVHPAESAPVDTLNFLYDSGLYGLKVHPEYQQFSFDNPAMFPVWERCIELNFPVLTHAGADIAYNAPFHSDPLRLAKFIERYPELRFIIAHLGSFRMWDDVEEHLLGKNVYLDLAVAAIELPPERLLSMIRRHGANRIVLGSDSPWFSQREMVEKINALPLTPAEHDAIFHQNAEELLRR